MNLIKLIFPVFVLVAMNAEMAGKLTFFLRAYNVPGTVLTLLLYCHNSLMRWKLWHPHLAR